MPNEQRRATSFDPEAVARVNRVIAQSGAQIVLSSSWRKFGLDKMRGALAQVGLQGRLIDRTPLPPEHDLELFRRLHGTNRPTVRAWPRGYEIQQWLDAHDGIAGIVILDDSVSMEHLRPWQIQTSMRYGFIDPHVEQALAILQSPPPPCSGPAGGSRSRPTSNDEDPEPRSRLDPPARSRHRQAEGMARHIIFLDIDGVLNTRQSRRNNEAERGFDRTTIERLNRLVQRTAADVVLSSAWRTFVDTEDMQTMLEGVGFVGRIVDRTPRMAELDPNIYRRLAGAEPPPPGVRWPRGYEIQQWLDEHANIEGIVILDDRDDVQHLSAWLVRTSFRDGLCDEQVDAAIRRLAEPGPAGTGRSVAPPTRALVRPQSQRFVFLDIDGVLSTARSRARHDGGWRDLDPEAVARLNTVIERTEAVVVLSSAWRKAIGIDEVQARLADIGFRGTLVDRTPSREEYDPAVFERLSGTKPPKTKIGWPRSYEIQQWLEARAAVEGVVILDDDEGMHHLRPWLVATSHVDGLQDVHVDRAVACLLAPPPVVANRERTKYRRSP